MRKKSHIERDDDMDQPMADLSFRMMTWMFLIRDLFNPRDKILEDIPLKKGDRVLDYGCGPGGYTFPAAKMTGNEGIVYALDIHPRAVERIKRISKKKGIKNIKTIKTDCSTGLPDRSLDLVLLFDIYHDLGEPEKILEELHRVLKPGGTLAFNDHHMTDGQIRKIFSGSRMFHFIRDGYKSNIFQKI